MLITFSARLSSERRTAGASRRLGPGAKQKAYLDWAVGAFRLATGGVADDIHIRRGVGPGVWDIHSPRVPPHGEVVEALRQAIVAVPAQRLWVNPDCGLKTRGYPEVEASLRHLVAAAAEVCGN